MSSKPQDVPSPGVQELIPPSPPEESPPAQGALVPPKSPPKPVDLISIYDFSADVLAKRYEIYTWCESKINTLVTLDGLLLGALFLVLESRKLLLSNSFEVQSVGFALACLFGSLGVALYHTIPKMHSGTVTKRLVRSIHGTRLFDSNAEYRDELLKKDLAAMIDENADQIRGMTTNIWRNQRAIRIAVWLTLTGMASFGLYIVGVITS